MNARTLLAGAAISVLSMPSLDYSMAAPKMINLIKSDRLLSVSTMQSEDFDAKAIESFKEKKTVHFFDVENKAERANLVEGLRNELVLLFTRTSNSVSTSFAIQQSKFFNLIDSAIELMVSSSNKTFTIEAGEQGLEIESQRILPVKGVVVDEAYGSIEELFSSKEFLRKAKIMQPKSSDIEALSDADY